MAPKIHPNQVDKLSILSSQLKQIHHAFLPKKK
jgi:hypothetical protein